MNKHDLIQKVKALDGISQDERAYLIDLINTNKKYGLVWEDKPEDVEETLRQHLPVLQEVVEKRIIGKNAVQDKKSEQDLRIEHDVQDLRKIDTLTLFDTLPTAKQDKNAEQDLRIEQDGQDFVKDLMIEQDKQDFENNPSNNPVSRVNLENPVQDYAPNHTLIEGDNLHALTALTFTHENKIDVIYIDPPYNTGNKDFKYNDSFVDKEDSYRHSKWLSFMDKRLRIAKRLLSDKGVIFISIDENEAHNLKLLMDEIFGESNFVEQLIWNKRIPKNDKGIGNIHEYVLLYAKLYSSEHSFVQKKDGIDDVNLFVMSLAKKKISIQEAEKEVKKFFKKNGYDRGITLYNSLDKNYKLWGKINVSWPNAKTVGPRYDVLHPKTLKPCKVPDRGWRFTKDTFDSFLDYENVEEQYDGSFVCGKIWFAKDENTQPSTIKYLEDVNEFLLRSILSTKSDGSNELNDVLGIVNFDYPKPTDLLERLINSVNEKSATILDFFAGSGTTLHATMALNAEDGGSRQCILVTNNENNICEEVTYERNKRIIEGYTNAKGELIAGLSGNNLRYYKTAIVEREPSLRNKRQLTRLATELLCIKEDCYTPRATTDTSLQAFEEKAKRLLLLCDDAMIDEALEYLKSWLSETTIESPIKVYVFSNGQYPYTEDFEEVLPHITLCALPDAIYKAYQYVLPKRVVPVRIELEEEDSLEQD